MARLMRSQFARAGHSARMLQSPGVGSVQDVIAIGPSRASTMAATLIEAGDRARLYPPSAPRCEVSSRARVSSFNTLLVIAGGTAVAAAMSVAVCCRSGLRARCVATTMP